VTGAARWQPLLLSLEPRTPDALARDDHPFAVPAIRTLPALRFDAPVACFV